MVLTPMLMRLLNNPQFMAQGVGNEATNNPGVSGADLTFPPYDPQETVGPFDQPNYQPQPFDSPDFDTFVEDYMAKNYHPNTVAQEAYQQHLNRMPRREDFAPSKLRQITAAIAGMGPGGFETGEAIRDLPFNRQLRDWTLEEKPLGFAYNEEFKGNNLQRQLLSQAGRASYQQQTAETNRRKAEETERTHKQSEELKERDIARKEAADRSRDWVRRNPQWKTVASKGGNYWLINPITGDKKDTGIATGTLTDLDKLEMNFDNRMTLEDILLKNKGQLEEQEQGNRIKLKQTPGAEPIGSETTSVTEISPEGTKKTTRTTKGPRKSGEKQVIMIGPDGRQYSIPSSKIEEAKKQGMRMP